MRYRQRLLADTVAEALTLAPAVILTGARQTGKSTLVQHLKSAKKRTYLTLDDLDTLDQAKHDPNTLVSNAGAVTIDEIQREPALLLAVKKSIDKKRRKGRFLLTGSANLLIMKQVSESLAGRAIYLTLHPMTVGERLGLSSSGFWQRLLNSKKPLEAVLQHKAPPKPFFRIKDHCVRGGYPPAALAKSTKEREYWFQGYVRTYLERDIQDFSAISGLTDFRRLMKVAAYRTARLANQSEMGRDANLSQATTHRYLNILEASQQIVRLAAFARNPTKRLIKMPKLYWSDTGLVNYLMGPNTVEARSQLVENLVLQHILAHTEIRIPRPEITFWRTTSGQEVDFIIEDRKRLFAIEVKAATSARSADVRHLKTFIDGHSKETAIGILAYMGSELRPMSERIVAVPIAMLL